MKNCRSQERQFFYLNNDLETTIKKEYKYDTINVNDLFFWE